MQITESDFFFSEKARKIGSCPRVRSRYHSSQSRARPVDLQRRTRTSRYLEDERRQNQSKHRTITMNSNETPGNPKSDTTNTVVVETSLKQMEAVHHGSQSGEGHVHGAHAAVLLATQRDRGTARVVAPR